MSEDFASREPAAPPFILLTGARGAGKTTLCERVVATLKRPGAGICGVISRAVLDSTGERFGYEARELTSGWKGRLAAAAEPPPGSLHTGRYVFDETTIERCVAATIRAINDGANLLVLDEIGPLEMEQHRGFFPILGALRGRKHPQSLVTVRPSLAHELAALLTRWGIAPAILEVTPDTADAAYRALQRRLAPFAGPSPTPGTGPSESL